MRGNDPFMLEENYGYKDDSIQDLNIGEKKERKRRWKLATISILYLWSNNNIKMME